MLGYSPYQPGMAIFGVPRAVLGDHWWTDARVWFAAATVAALLDEVMTVPGTGGVLLVFDDFLKGLDDFGTRIQPLMRSRRHVTGGMLAEVA